MSIEDQKRIVENARAVGTLGAQHPVTAPVETVHAHVERTVHRLLDEIERECTARVSAPDWAHRVKLLSDSVNTLSAASFVFAKPGLETP